MDRLNKLLAHAGVGSRRHCDDLIAAGRVSIDGKVIRELGTRVEDGQRVAVDGEPIRGEKQVYWLVNKPRGCLCTNYDPSRRPLVTDLVPHVSQRVYTVGRLDEDSEGLVLLTNDGDLANKLMHPRFGVEKTYLVQVAGTPHRNDLDQLLKGVWLSEGHVKAKNVKRLEESGRKHLAANHPQRRQEPRDSPDARQAQAQGDAPPPHRDRPGGTRQAFQGKIATAVARRTGVAPFRRQPGGYNVIIVCGGMK